MQVGASVLVNGETLTLSDGFTRLVECVAVALAAPDVATATHMYLRLGAGERFAELIQLSQRVEAQRLVRALRERAIDGLTQWADRYDAPAYEIAHAIRLLNTAMACDFAAAAPAMNAAETPEQAGWALASHLVQHKDGLGGDVIPRDIARAIAKAGLRGGASLANDFRSLQLDPSAFPGAGDPPVET